MHLLSAIRNSIQARIPGRKPAIVGREEVLFPAPCITIPSFTSFELSIEAGEVVLHNHGRYGIIEIGDLQHVGETDEQAMQRAKTKRLGYVRAFLNDFRRHNASLRAGGKEILMPDDRHLEALREMKGLMQELGYDELMGPAGTGGIVDVAGRELGEFGISPEAASLTPGVEPSLSGVDL